MKSGGFAPFKPPSMNYANMIEEKSLKKGFIIATLISTIIGTFTTGINLYDRVSEKRKQANTDRGQDDKINALEKRLNDSENARKGRGQRGEDLRDSLEAGGPLIRREYDRDYGRLGARFAEGDLLTQTQLQSQIITLQSTVIKMLEEALFTGKIPDVKKLYNASEFAREGSIRALRDQYQRLLLAAPVKRPIGPVRRISSTPTLRDHPAEPDPYLQFQAVVPFSKNGPLFCRYAEDLQQTRQPLDNTFADGRSGTCPDCAAVIPLQPGRAWKIYKEIAQDRVTRDGVRMREVVDEVPFVLTNRFIIKCHREAAGFACVLCYRHRDKDTLCETMEDLANHVLKKHDIREYDPDPDIKEVDRPFGPPARIVTS
ncbi:hypothetical protein GQ53DRAFT_693458 [Thozetella sp. PMI_491]|nr:hypothetical protein GQ53DRAFT_693458 [Thozetella sp. PMI_491]